MSRNTDVAIIVGASRGIGEALARVYLDRGGRVAAVARTASQIVTDYTGDELLRVEGDVTDSACLERAADEIGRWSAGGASRLIHNAGILTGRDAEDPAEADPEDLLRSLDVNVVGAMRSVRAFVSLIRDAAGSRVALISSLMGSIELARGTRAKSYSVSKAALNMYGRLLHNDLERESIGVMLLHPGWVRTDMGGAEADIDVKTSAEGLYDRIEGWEPGDPLFRDYSGKEIPW